MNYSDTFLRVLLAEADDAALDVEGDQAALGDSMDATGDDDQYNIEGESGTSPEDLIKKLTERQGKWKADISTFRKFVTDIENNESLVKQIIRMERFPAFEGLGDDLLKNCSKIDEMLAVVDSRLTRYHQEAERNYENYKESQKAGKA